MTGRLYAVLERVVARRATVVLGVSQDLVDRMEARPARGDPRPTPPGQPADPSATRSALGVADDSVLVVVVARLAPQKGLHLLLDAVAGLADLPLEVVVAGDGLHAELQARICAEGLPVRLLGHRTDVPDLCGQPTSSSRAPCGRASRSTCRRLSTRERRSWRPTSAGRRRSSVTRPSSCPGATRTLARGIRLATDPAERERLRGRARERAACLPSEADAVEAALRVCEVAARW